MAKNGHVTSSGNHRQDLEGDGRRLNGYANTVELADWWRSAGSRIAADECLPDRNIQGVLWSRIAENDLPLGSGQLKAIRALIGWVAEAGFSLDLRALGPVEAAIKGLAAEPAELSHNKPKRRESERRDRVLRAS